MGGKLRGFRKRLDCSEAEALGILTVLWLWARKNADISGLLGNVDRDDIASELRPKIDKRLDADIVTDALIEFEWIDESNGSLYVHDWQEWQSYWYTYLEKKERDKERKRRERAKDKDEPLPEAPVPKAEETPVEPCKKGNDFIPAGEEEPKDPPKKPSKPKKKKEEITKTKLGEFVSMTDAQVQKLIDGYGEPFTKKCIEVLDNYKGATGRKYQDDYRAVLSWVADKVKREHPELVKKNVASPTTGNPFRQ